MKMVGPLSELVFGGIQVDAKTGVLTIPQDKILQIHRICVIWMTRMHTIRRQLQRLLGKLLHITRCVGPARLFLTGI